MTITLEAIRAAGGIVHSDGNIFFRDISMLQGLAGAAPAAVAAPAREEIAALREEHGITSSGRGIKEFERVDAFVRAVLQRWGAAPALEAPAHQCCNSWFLSLPEGRQAVLRENQWMLADAAYQAGCESRSALEAPAAPETPPLTPDEARWAARSADRMRGPSDVTSGTEYAMTGAMALAKKLAAAPQAPAKGLPYEPTSDMLIAGRACDPALPVDTVRAIWWAMWRTAPQAPAAPVAAAIPDAAYCALQYVEHALAAIANREELSDGAIERVDTIGKASKRAKAALTRLQAVAHHFDVAAPTTPTKPFAYVVRWAGILPDEKPIILWPNQIAAHEDGMRAAGQTISPLYEGAAPAAPAVDASDTARMDWLEKQVVNVRAPLRYGSRDMFWASPEEVDGGPDGPSDLRARIDAAQAAAKGEHGNG